MLTLPLASISLGWKLFIVLWLLLAAALIMVVLIQKGRGGGLGAALGGGASNSLLGTKTGDFLTWVTICLAAVFLLGAVVMGKFMRPLPSSLAPVAAPATQAAPGGAAVPVLESTEPEMPVGEGATAEGQADLTEQSTEPAAEVEVPQGDADQTEQPAPVAN